MASIDDTTTDPANVPSAPAADPLDEARRFAARGRTLLAISALFFGAMAVATRGVASELPAPQIASVRFAIGLAGVGAVVAWRPGTFRATRWDLLAMRGLFGGLAVLGYFMALERLNAGLGTLLNYTFPLWAALFAAAFLDEKLTAKLAGGMALATAGLAVVVGPDAIAAVSSGLGDERVRFGLLAGLVSSVLGGAATTTIRAVRRTDSAIAVFFAFCVGGLAVCLPMAMSDWRPVSPRAAVLLAIVGVLSFVAQMLFTYALKFVTAGAGSLTTQLTVVASYAFATLFLGEPVTLRTAMGATIVMAGVMLVSRGERRTPAVGGR